MLGKANESSLCLVQIETAGALADLDGIANVAGVDVLFVGARDLTQALGCPGETSSPLFLDALKEVVRAAAAAGISAGILASRPEDVDVYRDRGFNFIGVGSDSSMLAATATTAAAGANRRQSGSEGAR